MTDEKPIRIIRAAHESAYFICSRRTAQDKSISYEALGVLAYLLSQPSTWEVNVHDIAKRSTEYKIYKVLRELREAGYMKLEKEKGKGKASRWVYQVYEVSQLVENREVVNSQLVENQLVENQLVEIRHTKRIQSLKENKDSKEITHSKSPATSAGLEQAEPQTKSKKKPAPSKPSNQPAVKPTETKAKPASRKKQTPLQAALEAMQSYRELIHEMAMLCKVGYKDSMGDPEHSLTVKELQSYTEAAEDYFRLGGKLDQVQAIYKYVDNQHKNRTWKIAPASIVKGIAGYQAQLAISNKSKQAAEQHRQQQNSPTGTIPIPQDTEAERAEKLRLIREGRERIQGAKQA